MTRVTGQTSACRAPGLSLDVWCSRASRGPGCFESSRLPGDARGGVGGSGGVSGPLKSGPGNADPFPALGLGQAQNLPGNVCQRSFLRFHANHQELNTLKKYYLLSPLASFFSFGSELALEMIKLGREASGRSMLLKLSA